jgi:SAM-dependent methyltransferase
MIRWLTLDGNLPSGSGFFKRELQRLKLTKDARILISGAADTGILAMVIGAFEADEPIPQIALVDQCKTTVIQNRLFCDYLGLNAECIESNITNLNYEKVDVIVAHSFLLFFPGPARQEIVRCWRNLLKPGGIVLLSNRVCESEAKGPPKKDQLEIDDSMARLVRLAEKAGFSAGSALELGDSAKVFWSGERWRQPYLTAENLQQCFARAGLKIQSLHIREKSRSGPARSFIQGQGPDFRAELVAYR